MDRVLLNVVALKFNRKVGIFGISQNIINEPKELIFHGF